MRSSGTSRRCAPGGLTPACSTGQVRVELLRHADAHLADGERQRRCPKPRPDHDQALGEGSQAKAIDKALRDSDLGINPQVDGELIRIPIPALTEDRRKEMVKLTKKYGEECKVAIRKHRRDANEMVDQLDKDGDVGGDDADRAKKKVEDVVAEGVKQVDVIAAAKEKDILEV